MSNMTERESYEFAAAKVGDLIAAATDLIATMKLADQVAVAREVKKAFDAIDKAGAETIKGLGETAEGVDHVATIKNVNGSVGWKKVAEALAAKSAIELDEAFLKDYTGKGHQQVNVAGIPGLDEILDASPVWCTLDVETTGFAAKDGDRIIDIGLVRFDTLTGISTEFSSRVNPEGRKSNPKAIAAHGITDEELVDAPTWASIQHDVALMTSGAIIVAHNAKFDMGFLLSTGIEENWKGVICTNILSKTVLTNAPDHKLDTVLELLKIEGRTGEKHGALEDAQLTLLAFDGLLRARAAK